MRIVHVSDFYLPRLGGVELHVRDLARRQLAAGHDVTVLTATARGGSSAHDRDDVPVVRLNDGARHVLHPQAARRLRRALTALQPDVVHAHAGGVSPLAFSATLTAPGLGVATVFTTHSILGPLAPVMRGLDTLTSWSGLPVAWTAVSEVAAQPLRRLVGGKQIAVLPNGIDPHGWHVAALPRDPAEVVVLAVMRLARRKRPLPLLRVLEDARRRTPPGIGLRAVIVGDGPLRPATQALITRRELRWVDLRGRQTREQIRQVMGTADIFVAPARQESFGIAALEARCAGVPVVADRRGGVTTFVRDGEEGILTGDDRSMAQAISALARDAKARRAMAARSRATPVAVSWSAVIAQTEDVYAHARDLARASRAREHVPARAAGPGTGLRSAVAVVRR